MQSLKELEKKIIGTLALTAGALFATSFALGEANNAPEDEAQVQTQTDKYYKKEPVLESDGLIVHQAEGLGYAMSFESSKLYQYANEYEANVPVGYVEYNSLLDDLKLVFLTKVDGEKVEFWMPMDGPQLFNQFVKNAPEFLDHALTTKQGFEAEERANYSSDVAFFFDEENSFSRDGDQISITFNALQITCTADLADTKDYGEKSYHNMMSCAPQTP